MATLTLTATCDQTLVTPDGVHPCVASHAKADLAHVAPHPDGALVWPRSVDGMVPVGYPKLSAEIESIITFLDECGCVPPFHRAPPGPISVIEARIALENSIAGSRENHPGDDAWARKCDEWAHLPNGVSREALTIACNLNRLPL